MSLKRILLLVAMVLIAFWAGAQGHDRSDCLVKVSSKWGSVCERCEYYTDGYKRDYSGTFRIELRNTCREILEVKVAMQEKDGTWRTFPVRALAPDETLDAFACRGSGKYLYWVRKADDTEIVLPSDQEILTEYRSR
jgi:hypothetical protein